MRDRHGPPRKPSPSRDRADSTRTDDAAARADAARPASPWPDRPPPRPYVDKKDRLRRFEPSDATPRRAESRSAPRRDESHPPARVHEARAPHDRSEPRLARDADTQPPPSRRHDEARYYGVNACQAIFAHRPDDIRKVYLTEARIATFRPLLAWCVKHRIGYRVVEDGDLDKLTESRHHEGVCFDVRRAEPLALGELLAALPRAPSPALLLWLDGVGNPHNFGAVLRSAAHFGAAGVILPADSTLALAGAAARVAEGGAEAVPIARAGANEPVADALRRAGFAIGATVPRGGRSLYDATLPARLALVFGAEREGMSAALIGGADVGLTIPGRGAVESLNVAASVAVVVGEWFRQHGAAGA